jgi:hypothetical protein
MLYFEITETDSVKKYNVQKCECSFELEKDFQKLIECETIFSIKIKTPGPSHRIDDELKAPGSLWSKGL